jgi:hypothetical protein
MDEDKATVWYVRLNQLLFPSETAAVFALRGILLSPAQARFWLKLQSKVEQTYIDYSATTPLLSILQGASPVWLYVVVIATIRRWSYSCDVGVYTRDNI